MFLIKNMLSLCVLGKLMCNLKGALGNTVHLLLKKCMSWILTKLGRNHPQGLGIQRCSYGTCGHHGGPGGGPQGPKRCKFQTSSPDPVKVEQ